VSQENVEIVRAIHEEWRNGHLGRRYMVDDIEYVNPPNAVEPGTRIGADSFENVFSVYETVRFEIDRLIDGRDKVVMIGKMTGRARATGIEMERAHSQVWTLRHGKATRMEWFHDEREALEAAGLHGEADNERGYEGRDAGRAASHNVEVVRELFDAVGRGDLETALRLARPDGEWVNPDYAMEPGTRRGLSGLRMALSALRDSFDDLSFEISQTIDLDDRVLVTGTFSGTGRTSGAAFGPQVFGAVVTFVDGKIRRYEWYLSAEEARRSAGLSE
jgi:ketosteroid isomerase-like protein